MTKALTIFLAALLLWGCSQKASAPTHSVAGLIEAGKDTTWGGNYVVHVDSRNGDSISGVRIVSTEPGGQQRIITADSGTVSEGSDQDSVRITLRNARTQKGESRGIMAELVIDLHK